MISFDSADNQRYACRHKLVCYAQLDLSPTMGRVHDFCKLAVLTQPLTTSNYTTTISDHFWSHQRLTGMASVNNVNKFWRLTRAARAISNRYNTKVFFVDSQADKDIIADKYMCAIAIPHNLGDSLLLACPVVRSFDVQTLRIVDLPQDIDNIELLMQLANRGLFDVRYTGLNEQEMLSMLLKWRINGNYGVGPIKNITCSQFVERLVNWEQY